MNFSVEECSSQFFLFLFVVISMAALYDRSKPPAMVQIYTAIIQAASPYEETFVTNQVRRIFPCFLDWGLLILNITAANEKKNDTAGLGELNIGKNIEQKISNIINVHFSYHYPSVWEIIFRLPVVPIRQWWCEKWVYLLNIKVGIVRTCPENWSKLFLQGGLNSLLV